MNAWVESTSWGFTSSARWAALLLGCTLTACGGSSSTSPGAAEGSGSSGASSPSTGFDTESEAGTDGTSGDAGESETTAAPIPFEPYPARGVRVPQIYANQGVGVPIVRDGDWVDGTGRNAALVANRTTMIRGFWELDDDFEPRNIMARLRLLYPDGTEESAERIFEVTEDGVPSRIDTNMYFVVPGELLPVGTRFQVELFETEPGYEDLPEPTQTAYPPEPGVLGVEDKDLALSVVLVPVRHNLGAECPEAPEISDEDMQFLADELFMQNPVQRVEIQRRDPVDYTSPMTSFSPLLGFLAELRAQDNADPAAYYYGLVVPCDGGAEGVGGQAISIPSFPTLDNAWTRTSMGRWYGSIATTADTFVHEVGHTQGRRHVFCNGQEGGVDPTYPYDAGDIGVWGFGVLNFTLYTPNNGKDYMTYCGNTWVSDWTWGKVLPFIEEITSWGAADVAPDETKRVLVGLVDSSTGEETWFVTQGSAAGIETFGTEPVLVHAPQMPERTLDGVYGPMGDGDGYVVAVDLPPDVTVDPSMQLTRLHEGQARPVSEVWAHGNKLSLRQSP